MNENVVGCMLYNIIICDDNSSDLNQIINITQNYFNNKQDFCCKIHSFHDYNDNFINFICTNRLSNLIYILDIETPSGNGFDMARIIKRLDQNIPIIYITEHYQYYTKRALDTCDMNGYINKIEKLNEKLIDTLEKITNLKGKKYLISVKNNNTIYKLNVEHINYFATGDKNRVTVFGINYPSIYISMKSLYRQLGHQFSRTHQSCIVNFDNVKEFHIKSKIIFFNDGTSTDLIARDFVTKNKDWLYEHYMDKIIFK